MIKKEITSEKVLQELLKTLKRAVKQSSNTMLRSKKKLVNIEYDEELKKPMQELTEESEELTKIKGMVDINSLKLITGLLKEIYQMKESAGISADEERGIVVLADLKDLEDDGE